MSTASPNNDEDSFGPPEEKEIDEQESGSEDEGRGTDGTRCDITIRRLHSDESQACLLVNMTTKLQEEGRRREDVEKRNHTLLMELDRLQKELLVLRADQTVPSSPTKISLVPAVRSDAEAGELCWNELLDAKEGKEKALVEAHQRTMQVMELNACISMQHDELAILRTSNREDREAFEQSEMAAKELRQERQLLTQETKLLRDNVEHLTVEMGKRGAHFNALMEKWTEAQAQSEHRERENTALREQLHAARQRAELRQRELETLRDERDALQHQANQLKGAVAAKTAESKAFQAYGASAREHLQSQQAAIQRHAVYRRQVNGLARDAITSLRRMRATLTQTRSPLVAIQGDFGQFLEKLRAPVMILVERSSRYAKTAHAEHEPLRLALRNAELARRHLHEQLWRAKRDALLVCQLQNVEPSSGTDNIEPNKLVLRANYSSGELFLRENGGASDVSSEVLGLKCDALFSDRAREWNRHESVTPLLQSVLDGCNACVVTFVGAPSLHIGGPTARQTVSELLLRELFATMRDHGSDARFYRTKVTVSCLAVFNETVYDLLGLGDTSASPTKATTPSTGQIVVLEVQNADEALMVLAGGREYLTATAGQQGGASESIPVLAASLTHTVVTVCVTYESLLTGVALVNSKLQIVELACGGTSGVKCLLPWSDSREDAKLPIAVENGAEALVTVLGEVRLKDVAFVRYHSSKLTVLLQDTVKPGAKFLALVGLPSSCSTCASSENCNLGAIVRVLQQIRTAVGGSRDSQMVSKGDNCDRSLEGFMNRLALQHPQFSNDLALPFSSFDMQDHARHYFDSTSSWDAELDLMMKRYGKDAIDSIHVAPSSSLYPSVAELDQQQQHRVLTPTAVHPMDTCSTTYQPPPAPVHKPKSNPKGGKVPRNSNIATTKNQVAMILRDVRSVSKSRLAITTTRPTATLFQSQSSTGTVLKIRRETTSSALKKNLLHRRDQHHAPFRWASTFASK